MNVLLIAPDTFGYYQKIVSALNKNGYRVRYINQLPNTHILFRLLARYFPFVISWYLKKINSSRFLAERDYDVVWIIKGESIDVDALKLLKHNNPNAKFVYYTWDSLNNCSWILGKANYFDDVFSFDAGDCLTNKELQLQPLFFKKFGVGLEIRYGCFFVGTVHSSRYIQIHRLSEQVERLIQLPSFLYFYYPKRWMFVLKNMSNPRLWVVTDVNFNRMTLDHMYEKLRESRVVLDICHDHQTGLTMRTMETLGNGKKLITNNTNIKQYAFYDASNIYLIGEKRPLHEFLTADNTPVSMGEFEIDQWVLKFVI